MRKEYLFIGALFCLSIIALLSAGCSTTPPSKFYTLQSIQQEGKHQGSANASQNIFVGVGPVTIPDYIDRVQIVTRTKEGQLVRAEFDRWAGSLRNDISLVIVENLSMLLSQNGVSTVSWGNFVPITYRVAVDITRFDAIPGERVFLSARWFLYSKKSDRLVISRESNINEQVEGQNYSAVVKAMSSILAQLSRDIAGAIKGLLKEPVDSQK